MHCNSNGEWYKPLYECNVQYKAVVDDHVPEAIKGVNEKRHELAMHIMMDTTIKSQACEEGFMRRILPLSLTELNTLVHNLAYLATNFNEVQLDGDDVLPDVADPNTVIKEVTDSMERQRYRQESLDFKTIDAAPKCETKLDIERHAARVYTMTIFLLVQKEIIEDHFFTKKGKEQEKKNGTMTETPRYYKIAIEYHEIFMESHVIHIESHVISLESHVIHIDKSHAYKDEVKMGTYVENLKKLLDEVKADMPNPPSRNTGDVIGGIFSITKPNQIYVQNPTKAVNKGEHLKKGERLKSEREKALKDGKKKLRVCGFCKQKTNEHTKTTCPLNPKAKKKRKATPIIDV
ncbi:FAR1-related sequence 5-like protein [Tanacetum coccineum]